MKSLNINLENVYIAGLADANVPKARGKDTSKQLCESIHAVNTSVVPPMQACTFFEFPDHPCAGSARGIADEESKFQSHLWELTQHLDTRYIMTYDPPNTAAAFSNMRRWSMGRCVVDNETRDENKWLASSELAVLGRACTTTLKVVLPRQSEIVVPEKLSPNDDLFISERKRPSDTEIAAQKGHMNKAVLICAALGNMPFDAADIVVFVNSTGHVEEAAEAVPWLPLTPSKDIAKTSQSQSLKRRCKNPLKCNNLQNTLNRPGR